MISDIQAISDIEFDSGLNVALSTQGHAKFSLLLSMLEQDYLQRLQLVENKPEATLDSRDTFLNSLNDYPSIPLHTRDEDYRNQNQVGAMLHSSGFGSCRLLLSAFPTPLSMVDDKLKIEEEIVANCGFHTQQKLSKHPSKQVEVKETALYEVLQNLSGEALPAQVA